MPHPPAGWYDDPAQSGRLRFWDGQAWTEHLADRPEATPEAPREAATAVLPVTEPASPATPSSQPTADAETPWPGTTDTGSFWPFGTQSNPTVPDPQPAPPSSQPAPQPHAPQPHAPQPHASQPVAPRPVSDAAPGLAGATARRESAPVASHAPSAAEHDGLDSDTSALGGEPQAVDDTSTQVLAQPSTSAPTQGHRSAPKPDADLRGAHAAPAPGEPETRDGSRSDRHGPAAGPPEGAGRSWPPRRQQADRADRTMPALPGPRAEGGPRAEDGRPLAPVWRRLLAWLIDSLLVWAVTMLPAMFLVAARRDDVAGFTAGNLGAAARASDSPAVPPAVLSLYLSIALVWVLLYFLAEVIALHRWGTTPGRAAMSLTVRSAADGAVPSLEALTRRTSVKILGHFFSAIVALADLGLLILLFDNGRTVIDPQRRSWHDIAGGTQVVLATPEDRRVARESSARREARREAQRDERRDDPTR